jgi:energy-coupling factor transporter ATP-binding protein EcfA2
MFPETRERCDCGASAWTRTKPKLRLPASSSALRRESQPLDEPALPGASPPPDDPAIGTLLDGNDVPPMIVDDYPGAQINELLGGIYRGALVLVVGAAGAGKSTFSAELAAVAATCLDSSIYWLDRDQKHPELVRACFATLGTEDSFSRVKLVQPPTLMPREWGIVEALALVPSDAAILILDSLETWGVNDTIRLAVLDRVKEHPARLKLVIAGTNAEGGVAGVGALERADDATVYVEIKDGMHTIRRGKCRWPPCRSALERAALRASFAPEEDAAEGSPAGRMRSTVHEPDFSIEAIERAASWSVREIEAYRARLRIQGVPRDTLLGWDRAVAEHKAMTQKAVDAPRAPPHAGMLPERTRAAYAAVLRCWPSTWDHGVRVSEIIKAIERDSLGDLAVALRDLAGTRDGLPSAIEIGNALKWMRDQSVDGMTLTRTLDRNRIALWRVVSDR